jgi:hypothetical protein
MNGMHFRLNQGNVQRFTFLTHIVGPNAGLNFSDVRFAEVKHASTRLSDTATDTQGKTSFNQSAVEVEFQAFFLSAFLKLA